MVSDKIVKLEKAMEMQHRSSEIDELRTEIQMLKNLLSELNARLDGGIRLYSIEDVMELTGYSKKKVQEIFNDPDLVVIDRGKRKFVEENVLRNYFSTRHNNNYWKKLERMQKNKAQKAA